MRATSSAFLVLPLLAAGACTDSPPATGDASGAITCGAPTYFRIDRVDLPEHFGDGAQMGVDLDGDGTVDNAVGDVLAGLVAANPEIAPMGAKLSARVTGDVTWELAVSSCDDGTQHIELGNSGGEDTVPLSLLGDPSGAYAPVAWGRVAHLVADVGIADGTADGVIGFGIPVPDAGPALVAPFAAYLTRELAAGTSPYAAEVDANHDGVVTADEVLATPLGATLLMPDLTIDGSGYLSAGIHVHATRVP
jgi:hypothetical protein